MKVISKQTNSRYCVICGIENPFGVNANFYNMEDESVCALLTFKKEHRSYPERVHGGMITALLDELAGRAIWVKNPELLGVTMTMEVKFRKPVPYGEKLIGVGKITQLKQRTFTAESKLYDQHKTLLAECTGSYMILPADKMCEPDKMDGEDYNLVIPDGLTEIDI